MATTPQAPGRTQTAGSASEVLERTAAEAGTEASPPEFQLERSEAFDALVEEVRKVYVTGPQLALRSLQDHIRRRLGLVSMSPGTGALFGLIGIGIRLGLVVLATALFGQWTGIPWGRWAVILVFYGLIDAFMAVAWPNIDDPVPLRLTRMMEKWTSLLPTIAREAM